MALQRQKTKVQKGGNEKQDIIVSIAMDLLTLGATCAISYAISKYLSQYIQKQQTSPQPNQGAKERLTKILIDRSMADEAENGDDQMSEEDIRERVRRKVVTALELTEYETCIAEDVIDPADITTSFRDVGGIDDIKTELWDLVVLPIVRPDLFRSDSGLVSPPRGVLLYGAPGTGKTMLAKAIAKESGASFVNVRLSNIMNKWFGESNKLISATFSLARKLAPSVIFIDEIDTFLNQRDSSEGSAATSMKSEFLTLWDGMLSDAKDSPPITVLGATNRPYDVDTAILRRLPRTFEVGLPDTKSRLQILNLFLENHELSKEARAMIPAIAKVTKGYSGSDLKELCRAAAMNPIREITREASRKAVMEQNNSSKGKMNKKNNFGPPPGVKVRAVTKEDFKEALEKVKRTGETSRTFLSSERHNSSSNEEGEYSMGIDANELARSMQILQMMMNGGVRNTQEDATKEEDDDEVPSIN